MVKRWPILPPGDRGLGCGALMPTGRVVAGFGNLSKDNWLILTMDWVAEGFTLVLLGVLVASSRYGEGRRTRGPRPCTRSGRVRRGRLSAVT